ncbi:MAG: DegT/DnrJ/EryC1/StrS family aminotransferase [Deltaproteobacteria bacterium]|nr:DegT/DnrJ/EryC1/StrS family aminotransferase [Deltaproteobacteria bacterium]
MASRRPAILGGKSVFEEEIFVTRPIIPDREAYWLAASEIFDSAWLTNNGPTLLKLEESLMRRLDVAFCSSFSSGTAALLTALRALDLRQQVITTPFTFPATVHCIEWNGLEPVFCDIDPETYNLDPARVAEAIGSETSALLPVHVFGNPCDVEAFAALREKFDLKLIYDAAHAFGVRIGDRSIGTFGDVSALSFHATKVFHTAEGGALVSGDSRLLEQIRLLRNFGIVDENKVSGIGLNGKLSELHAALGLQTLKKIDQETASRRDRVARYVERFQAIEGLRLQRFHPGTERNYFNFTLQVDTSSFGLSRDQVHRALRAEKIVSRKYFSPLCSDNECYRHLPSALPENLPVATRLAGRILSLPLYGSLPLDAVDAIADALLNLRTHARGVASATCGALP